MGNNGKPVIKSTQNGMNVLVGALAVFVPGIQDFVAANPEMAVGVFSILNIIWRTFITKSPISSVM